MNLKLLGQNLRTRISTIVAIGAYLNMVLAGFDPTVVSDDPTIITIYRWVSAILALCAWINSHYYNQDFTPIMAAHTQLGREEKKLQDFEAPYVEEPEDSYIKESEVIPNEI